MVNPAYRPVIQNCLYSYCLLIQKNSLMSMKRNHRKCLFNQKTRAHYICTKLLTTILPFLDLKVSEAANYNLRKVNYHWLLLDQPSIQVLVKQHQVIMIQHMATKNNKKTSKMTFSSQNKVLNCSDQKKSNKLYGGKIKCLLIDHQNRKQLIERMSRSQESSDSIIVWRLFLQ